MSTLAAGFGATEIDARRRGESKKYALLLIALTALIVVSPFLDRREESWLLGSLSASTLIAALYAIRSSGHHVLLATLLALIGVALNVLSLVTSAAFLAFGEAIAALAFYAFATYLIFVDVVTARRVSVDTVCGAICVYLLLGASFGLVYYALELIQPGSISLAAHVSADHGLWAALHYYSYVTLTTVGYGDISPASPAARSVAIVEGIAGQLYLAVLVARLIGRLGPAAAQTNLQPPPRSE